MSESFTHRSVIVVTFPLPETWHWMKQTVIVLQGERDVKRADNTGKKKNIPRESVGLQSANDIQRAWQEGKTK